MTINHRAHRDTVNCIYEFIGLVFSCLLASDSCLLPQTYMVFSFDTYCRTPPTICRAMASR